MSLSVVEPDVFVTERLQEKGGIFVCRWVEFHLSTSRFRMMIKTQRWRFSVVEGFDLFLRPGVMETMWTLIKL